jgi:hypothetical protein
VIPTGIAGVSPTGFTPRTDPAPMPSLDRDTRAHELLLELSPEGLEVLIS